MAASPAPASRSGCRAAEAVLLHATCVALWPGSVQETGVLLLGPSGSGKSDLALRLLDGGAALVADDQVRLDVQGGRLLARPPEGLAGLLEVRGLGIVRTDWLAEAAVRLAVRLVAPTAVERLPVPAAERFCGIEVPLFRLAPFEASAAARLRTMALALHRTIIAG